MELFAVLSDSVVQLVYFLFELVSFLEFVVDLGRELVYFLSLLLVLDVYGTLLEAEISDLFSDLINFVADVLFVETFLLLLVYQILYLAYELVRVGVSLGTVLLSRRLILLAGLLSVFLLLRNVLGLLLFPSLLLLLRFLLGLLVVLRNWIFCVELYLDVDFF